MSFNFCSRESEFLVETCGSFFAYFQTYLYICRKKVNVYVLIIMDILNFAMLTECVVIKFKN